MKVLGIETSCDDTGIAILEIVGTHFPPSIKIESNLVSSQVEIHRPWGGVVPNLARREHRKNLLPLLKETLAKIDLLQTEERNIPKKEEKELALLFSREEDWFQEIIAFLKNYGKPKIDLIAVTQGPGLAPALWTGINLAQALSLSWNIPLIPVNHLEGHLLSSWLPIEGNSPSKPTLPLISLVVSGGHTQIVLVENFFQYQLLGETRDDAAGECFDKTARLLDLGYPGGPPIAQAAKKWQTVVKEKAEKIPEIIKEISLPRPMIYTKNFDFSFAGLKTAVSYLHQKLPSHLKKSPFYSLKMADEIQRAINDVLIAKTIKAAKEFLAKGVTLSGGVSANQQLRERLARKCQENNLRFFQPPLSFSMDNAAMIALAGYCHRSSATNPQQTPSLQVNNHLSFKKK
jgi:N6-L-threonylcarbamoyladenine synthase